MSKSLRWILVFSVLMLVLSACVPTADQAEEMQVESQQQQYVTGQPIPQFTWSLPRHVVIEIYKAQMAATSTYSVVYNHFRGNIVFACPSIGYPIPGGTQLSNPEKYEYSGVTLPQPEPNGLFSPPTSFGTYVLCVAGDGSAYPVYIEESVMTFPFPVVVDANGTLVKAGEPSYIINVTTPGTTTVP